MYYVYILECSDKTFYCGYTNDLEKRLNDHNFSKKGAKYTKSRRPVKLIYKEEFKTINEALKREAAIKKLKRDQKILIISRDNIKL